MKERTTDVNDRPWEQPGVLRRDCEPHRGRLLLVLSGVSIPIGLLSLLLVLPAFLGLIIGVAALVLARHDLVEMRAGVRDSSGEAETRHALGLAVAGNILNGIALVIGLNYLLQVLLR